MYIFPLLRSLPRTNAIEHPQCTYGEDYPSIPGPIMALMVQSFDRKVAFPDFHDEDREHEGISINH
jgi:hypothetical protein